MVCIYQKLFGVFCWTKRYRYIDNNQYRPTERQTTTCQSKSRDVFAFILFYFFPAHNSKQWLVNCCCAPQPFPLPRFCPPYHPPVNQISWCDHILSREICLVVTSSAHQSQRWKMQVNWKMEKGAVSTEVKVRTVVLSIKISLRYLEVLRRCAVCVQNERYLQESRLNRWGWWAIIRAS